MKKLLAVLIITILCLSLVSCGSKNGDVSSAVHDNTASTETDSAADEKDKVLSLEEWGAENPDVIEAISSGADNIEVKIEGNNIIVIYTFSSEDITAETAKSDLFIQSLTEGTADAEQAYVTEVKNLESRSGIPDIILTIRYVYEGEPIVSTSFTKDGIVEDAE